MVFRRRDWQRTSTRLPSANFQSGGTFLNNGKQFAESFTIDQYDEAGNSLTHGQGKIIGTRIDVSTPPSSVFQSWEWRVERRVSHISLTLREIWETRRFEAQLP